ncbi:MAG: WGR domain-containing protein [Cyanobacteria bacterium J06607_13]
MATIPAVNQSNWVRLEYRSGRSNKFYAVQLVELSDGNYLCSTRWGAIGTPGTFKHYSFLSERAAHSKAIAKIEEKCRKGYQFTGTSELHWSSAAAEVRPRPPLRRVETRSVEGDTETLVAGYTEGSPGVGSDAAVEPSTQVISQLERSTPMHQLGRAGRPEFRLYLIEVLSEVAESRWAVDVYDCSSDKKNRDCFAESRDAAATWIDRRINRLKALGAREIPLYETNSVKLQRDGDTHSLWIERRFDGLFYLLSCVNDDLAFDVHSDGLPLSEALFTAHLALKHYLGQESFVDGDIPFFWHDESLQRDTQEVITSNPKLAKLIRELQEAIAPKPKSAYTTWL